MNTIGQKIRHARKRKAYTLDDLSMITKISKPYLSQIETNRVAPPSRAKLEVLERELGIARNELVIQSIIQQIPADLLPAIAAAAVPRIAAFADVGAGI